MPVATVVHSLPGDIYSEIYELALVAKSVASGFYLELATDM